MSGGPAPQPTPARPKPDDAPRTLPFAPYAPIPTAQPSRFVAPDLSGPPARRPLPLKALAITLVAVIAAGVAAGVAFVRFYQPPIDPDTQVQPRGEAQTVGMASPQEAVRAYFTALQDGDAARALELGPRGGDGSDALLSDIAYSRTHELGPLSDLRILTRDEGATEVRVSYRLGDTPHETTVRAIRLDNDTYQLARTTSTVQFEMVGAERVPLVVNGTDLGTARRVELVPGRYELSTGVPFLEYPESNNFTLTSLTEQTRAAQVNPQLTQAGHDALISAARDSLTGCLEVKSLSPKGCPFSIASRSPVDESTIVWALTRDPWTSATATLDPQDQSVARVSVTLQTSISFRYADGRSSGNNPVTVTAVASARMLGAQEDQLTISWET